MTIRNFKKSFKNLSCFFMFTAFMAVSASPALGGLPEAANLNLNQLSFIPNQGQIDQEVLFYHQGTRNHIFFTKTKVALLTSTEEGTRAVELIPEQIQEQCRVVGAERLAGRVTYLKGDPSQWKKDLPTYSGVVYQGVWPGIDLKFYAVGSQLEYDLMVAPGADPKAIHFALNGGARLEIGPQGELIVSVDGQTLLVQKKPVAYQEFEGSRREVEARYVVNDSSYGLVVADYDPARPLVIDPLLFSMYVGGTNGDRVYALAVDAQGYIYTAGSSSSTDYPLTTGLRPHAGGADCVITKFAPDGGSIDRSTYLGGDGAELCNSIAIRTDGEVVVAGHTEGGTFPVSSSGVPDSTHNGAYDIFVARLSNDLSSLRWAAYVGGADNDYGKDLDLDAADNVYLIGKSASTDFPTTGGAYQTSLTGSNDAVIFRLDDNYPVNVTLNFSTYLGGSNDLDTANGYDDGTAIAVSNNAVYVAGTTCSSDFPTKGCLPDTTTDWYDAFYGRLSLTGACQFMSLLGGNESGTEKACDLALSPAGDYFVLVGTTLSSNFPGLDGYDTSYNGVGDAFVAGINIAYQNIPCGDYAATRLFTTLLGGSGVDYEPKVAIGDDGSIYVGGSTTSTDFPVKKAVDPTFNGTPRDIYVTKLSADASALLWSTYLGGSSDDYLYGLAVDLSGAVIGGGYTNSEDFPVANPAEGLGEHHGQDDGVLFKLTPKVASGAPLNILLMDD